MMSKLHVVISLCDEGLKNATELLQKLYYCQFPSVAGLLYLIFKWKAKGTIYIINISYKNLAGHENKSILCIAVQKYL